MPIRILQEDDETYAVWFNDVDDFLERGLEREELIEWYIEYQTEILKEEIEDRIVDADRGTGPWREGPDTIEEAEEVRQVGTFDE